MDEVDPEHDGSDPQEGLVTESKHLRRIIVVAALACGFAGSAPSAQDEYTVKVPGGLAFPSSRQVDRLPGRRCPFSPQNFVAIATTLEAFCSGLPLVPDSRAVTGTGVPGSALRAKAPSPPASR
jgi:hypothetical protein